MRAQMTTERDFSSWVSTLPLQCDEMLIRQTEFVILSERSESKDLHFRE
jgi:hypothetical protein